MKNRNVILLHLKSENKNYFFGSITAIYDYLNAEILGVAYNTLRIYLTKDNVYENSKCFIERAELLSKVSPVKSKKAKERFK